MRGTNQRFPMTRFLLAAFLCIALTGCTIHIDCQTALQGIAPAEALKVPDVAIAVVTNKGYVFPKTLIVRGGDHGIVWVADGQSLTLDFGSAAIHPRCSGPVCVLDPLPAPPEKSIVYTYTGNLGLTGGQSVKLDPGLEVVK